MKLGRAAAMVVALLLIAGCSEDPKPRFEEPSETPTESSRPTSPPTDPSESPEPSADDLDPLGTVKAWTLSRNLALQTGDTAAARDLSAPGCRTCFNYLDPIEQVIEAGGQFRTEGWKIIGSNVRTKSAEGATVDVGFEFAAGRTIPAAGAEPIVFEADKQLLTFRLIQTDGQWLIEWIAVIR